jgi:hypothetical protein
MHVNILKFVYTYTELVHVSANHAATFNKDINTKVRYTKSIK